MIPHANGSICIASVRSIDTLGTQFEDGIAAVSFIPKTKILDILKGEYEFLDRQERLTRETSNGFCVTIFGHSLAKNDPSAVARRRKANVERNMMNAVIFFVAK